MKTIHLIAIAGLMVLATSCNTDEWYCHSRNEGKVELLSVHKKSIPYQEGNVSSFTDNNGHIVQFSVTAKNNWKQENAEAIDHISCSDYFLFEEDVITLKAESDNMRISQINICRTVHTYRNNNAELKWDSNICGIYVEFVGLNKFMFKYNQDGYFLTEEATSFHKTMKIGDQIYDDVVENRNGNDVLFYNQTYGILKVTQSGKDVLTINR